jgi:hypothetical protein
MAQRDHRGMTTVRAPVFRLERLNLTVPLTRMQAVRECPPPRQGDEAARAVLLWEKAWYPPGFRGLNPNLEDLGGLGLQIVFGMVDASPGSTRRPVRAVSKRLPE